MGRVKGERVLLLIVLSAMCAWAQTPQTRYLEYSTYVGGDALVLAANAAGLVCVASAQSGLTEINADGSLGYFKPYDQMPTFQGFGPTVNAVAIDSTGNCYLAGSSGIVPTPGAYQSVPKSMFVAEFDSQGNVVFATYLGGSGPDSAGGIALDASGNVWVAGTTASNDFPVVNPIQSTFQGGQNDAFISELKSDGTQLLFATYLGGVGNEGAVGIAIDGSGNVIVAGTTTSTNFLTRNPLEPTLGAANDGFITRISSAGQLVYSTYFGQTSDADIYDVTADSAGDMFVAGIATGPSFPLVNPLAGQQPPAFVSKLNSSGSAVVFSTYFGLVDGVAQPTGNSLQVDSQGNVYFGGTVMPGAGSIPLLNSTQGTPTSYYLAALDPNGNLVYSSFYGSAALMDQPTALSLGMDSSGNLYAGGLTAFQIEVPLLVPLPLEGTYDPFAGCSNCQPVPQPFVGNVALGSRASFSMPTALTPFGLTTVGTPNPISPAITVYNTGTTNIDISSIATTGDYSQTNNCPATLAPGTDCAVTVTFTPTVAGTRPGSVVISDDSPGNPHTIQLSGTAQAPMVVLYPTSLTFDPRTLNTTSKYQVVNLSISCCVSLTIGQISTSGDFAENNSCGVSLPPEYNCSIYVYFTPTALGTRTGTLTITDNLGIQTVPLTGTGTLSLGLGIASGSGSSSSVTVKAGDDTSYDMQIGGGGLSGTATFTCTGAPTGASCIVPSSESVSATTYTYFKVAVETSAPVGAALRQKGSSFAWVWAMALIGVVFLPADGRLWRFGRKMWAMLPLLPLLLIVFIASCGGNGNGGGGSGSGGTPAGTYTLTVTANTGSATQSQKLTLIVVQ
jgi:hypothetical protein